jgi:hypothetical protein
MQASRVKDLVTLDLEFLLTCRQPYRAYGTLPPHNPLKKDGILGKISGFLQTEVIRRVHFNLSADPTKTIIKMHSSVFNQTLDDRIATWPKELKDAVAKAKADPNLVAPMAPLEEELKKRWTVSGQALPEDSHDKGALKF